MNIKTIELTVGSLLNINEECIGRITAIDKTRFYIESEVFTGWADQSDIYQAIAWWETGVDHPAVSGTPVKW